MPPRLEPLKNLSNLPVAPLVAGVLGMLTAAVCALTPTGVLESLVIDSGIASVLSVAQPPLGITARAVLTLACGGGVALFAYVGLYLLIGHRALAGAIDNGDDVPVLRRADAHPDAPSRRPVLANRDLGTPFLDVRAEPRIARKVPPVIELSLPANLDLPLAAYDPGAIPDAPAEWFPVPAPLAVPVPEPIQILEPIKELEPIQGRQVFADNERFETFALTPITRSIAAEDEATPVGRSDTIHDLLVRLERGVARREPVAAPPPRREQSLQDTLTMLRHLAAQASEASPRPSALRG